MIVDYYNTHTGEMAQKDVPEEILQAREQLLQLTKPGPDGWVPECSGVACYIKKQHPARHANCQDVGDTPIEAKGFERFKKDLSRWWYWNVYPRQFWLYRLKRKFSKNAW